MVILMMSLKEPITRIPIHPESLFYLLPKEIIYLHNNELSRKFIENNFVGKVKGRNEVERGGMQTE